MRYFIASLCVLLFCAGCNDGEQKVGIEIVEDIEPEIIVESMVSSKFLYRDSSGTPVKQLLEVEIVQYNSDGDTVEIIKNHNNGSPDSKTVFFYDELGQKAAIQHFLGDAVLWKNIALSYDDEGNLTRYIEKSAEGTIKKDYMYDSKKRIIEINYSENGEQKSTKKRKYNDANLCISEEEISEEGILQQTYIHTYNEDGLLQQSISYGEGLPEIDPAVDTTLYTYKEGTLASKTFILSTKPEGGKRPSKTLQEYDLTGNLIRYKKWYDGEETEIESKVELQYDEHNNWTSKTIFQHGQPAMLTERVFTYFSAAD